jgi:hypothetical protein
MHIYDNESVKKRRYIYTYIHVCEIRFANSTVTRLEGTKKRTLYTSKETQTHMYCVFIEWNSAYFSFFCLYGNKKRTILLYYLVGWFLFRLIILCILDRSLLAFFFLSLFFSYRPGSSTNDREKNDDNQ